MPVIHFLDGPCDGKTRTVSQAVVDSGQVQCGGVLYVHYVAGASGPDIVFVPANSPLGQGQTGGGGGIQLRAPHALSGWADLRHTLNHGMPQMLRHVKGLNLATSHALARRRRVRH